MTKETIMSEVLSAGKAAFISRRRRSLFIILSVLLLILFTLDIFLGSVKIAPHDIMNAIFNGSGGDIATIVLRFRIPKALTALFVGIALSLSGLQMQTVFRNPMAGPYVLGVSSGASLGVAIVILGFSSRVAPANLHGLGNWLIVLSAWSGAGIVMLLIMMISSRVRDIMTILIIGIMLAGGISAIVSILQYFSNETFLKSYVIWTMGSLGNLSSSQLQVLIITVAGGVLLGIMSIKMLDAMLLGENYASSIGLNITTSRIVIFSCTSILAGSVTAFCGPIGFIGIAVPHIARRLFRTSGHAILIPGTILTGGAVLLLSDIVSQMPGSDKILPLNSITSLIGIPVVLWVILRNKKETGSF